MTAGGGLPFDEPVRPSPPARRIVTVSELTAALRDLVEGRFHEVWVEGELSGARIWNTGHLYFTLKDARAQVKGVMFRSSLRLLRFKPEDGVHVVARGRLSVYDPRGEYQLVCEHMEPRGLGALQLAYEQLRARLAAEGLFDDARKRPLPALPRRIGIVTSLDGAALRDIVRVLRRRHPNAHLVVAPARVQGETAARDLARALRQVTRVEGVDVVILARGGGSIEDLWAFNEEPLARAIVAAPVPVIAGIGHETDVTIADFVADLRAPTPSAAAELVVRRKDEFTDQVEALTRRASAAVDGRRQRLRGQLHRLDARPAFAGVPARVAFRQRHVTELAAGLRRRAARMVAERRRHVDALARALVTHQPQQRLARGRAALAGYDRRLAAALARRRHGWQTRLREAAAHLHAMSPLAVLGRGYAMCWTADGTTLVRTAAAVAIGDRIRVRLADGELGCDVREAGEVRHTDDRRRP
ncbi:MAG: exodeoxyribonuclease VII large subunit [Vicinamibacterales bacterium]